MTIPVEGARAARAEDEEAVQALFGQLALDLSSVRGGPALLRQAVREAQQALGEPHDLARVSAVGCAEPVRAAVEYGTRLFRSAVRAESGGAGARQAFVGTLDLMVVGVAVAACAALGGPAPVGRFEVLYVEEGARGLGVGAALVASALSWAAELGCSSLDGLALPGDRATKSFFEEHGFVTRLLVMRREIAR